MGNTLSNKFYFENSSTLSCAVYDSLMDNLIVEFKNGSTYEFVGVPKSLFDDLCSAESAGRFFAANVKSKYDFLKLI